MKKILLLAFLSQVLIIKAQDTTFFDANKNEVSSLSLSDFFRVKSVSINDTNNVKVSEFYSNGQIKSEINYKNYTLKKVDGKRMEWYKNGQLKTEIDYIDGEITGQILTFWENGISKRVDNYKKDKFISGKCFNKKGEQIKHFRYLIMPRFKKCLKKKKFEKIQSCTDYEMYSHIAKTTRYPKEALDSGLVGTVYIQYRIDTTGNVFNPIIVKGINGGQLLEEEALRVVKTLPKMIPGEQDGEKVQVQYTVPIKFNLR